MSNGVISLEQARAEHRCRICGQSIDVGAGVPEGWKDDFGEMQFPYRLTLRFGQEFAHTDCLRENRPETMPPKYAGPRERWGKGEAAGEGDYEGE